MKKTEIRCPRCKSIEIGEGFSINGIRNYFCNRCDCQWEETPMSKLQLELKEHAQYLKDGTKLTNQDKLDLQIDLWQYGKR